MNLNKYMGKPWVRGAEGPDEYDCWGLARAVQLEVFGRDVPRFPDPPEDTRDLIRFIRDNEHRRMWVKVDRPVHGAMVEMAHGRHPFHIGVYLDVDGGGILHSMNPAGTCWDTEVTMRASGWRSFSYHDWTG